MKEGQVRERKVEGDEQTVLSVCCGNMRELSAANKLVQLHSMLLESNLRG